MILLQRFLEMLAKLTQTKRLGSAKSLKKGTSQINNYYWKNWKIILKLIICQTCVPGKPGFVEEIIDQKILLFLDSTKDVWIKQWEGVLMARSEEKPVLCWLGFSETTTLDAIKVCLTLS